MEFADGTAMYGAPCAVEGMSIGQGSFALQLLQEPVVVFHAESHVPQDLPEEGAR